MLIVNNLCPDDTIATTFSQELAEALALKETTKYTELEYTSKNFKKYAPSIIINVSFPTGFRSDLRGFSVAAYTKTNLVDLTIYTFSRYLPSTETSGYLALPNAPYSTHQDIQLNLGYASNSTDVAWYTSADNRSNLISDFIHILYGDYSTLDDVDNPNSGILSNPYILKKEDWSGEYTHRRVLYNGIPIFAAEISGTDISITPTYASPRSHILRLLVQAVSSITTLRVKTGSDTYKTRDITSIGDWNVVDFTGLNASGALSIGTTGLIRISSILFAPSSLFGSLSGGYYFDDPRLHYSIIDPIIKCRAAEGLINKAGAISETTAQDLIDAINSAPINTDIFSKAISEFISHANSLKATEFIKIDPSKINVVYRDIEKNIPYIEDIVKKQNMMQMVEILKSSQIMVEHTLKSSLSDLYKKNDAFVKELENRSKKLGERLKIEGGK